MVVVTLETITTKHVHASDADLKHPLLADGTRIKEQSVVSKTMLRSHRRTSTPVFLKVPELIAPVEKVPTVSDISAVPLPAEVDSRKRPATEAETVENGAALDGGARPFKKARLVLLSPIRKGVRFELSSDEQCVKTHVHVFDRVKESEIPNLWYSGEEITEIKSREKQVQSVMSLCCDHYTSEVLNLMRLARNKNSVPGNAVHDSASPVWVANSPARGLEKDIVRGFKQRKRQVIRKVLEAQNVLKNRRHQETGEAASPDLQCRLLSNQYQNWSHPMVRFAQVLAEGDAQAVLDNAAVDPAPPPPFMTVF